MSRFLLSFLVLPAVALAIQAQPSETLIRLNMQPMPAPKPSLRYLLLPELSEMEPGNPIPNYLKCVLEAESSSDPDKLKKSVLRQADQAARLDKPDWQILLRAKTDGIGLLYSDVQKLRELANGLQMRFREEVNQRRFDDAMVTAKTMFALSRHLGAHPTLIGDLVGIAIAAVAIGPFEEMLSQPGCPNFYWALTNLPQPFISLDGGIQGERLLIGADLRDLDDTNPMTPEQLKKLIDHIDELIELRRGKKTTETRERLNERRKQPLWLAAAYNHLIEAGVPKEKLQQFPLDQVILLEEKREYHVRWDDEMKVMRLPYWEMGRLVNPSFINANKIVHEPALFDRLLPFMIKVRRAQGRLEQRFALLRHAEAIRMYAAENKGKLPAKLSDITVPLPVDPFTGKPFKYTLDGDTAHLRGTPPKDYSDAVHNIHYEITIQK
ncbi:MAG TPA: hypothetical protein VGZ47_20460 [Gemmataceae bacterium]|jgi:hypothetical protein|nr:hypothetical protein [Gemmataceae bacterium]